MTFVLPGPFPQITGGGKLGGEACLGQEKEPIR